MATFTNFLSRRHDLETAPTFTQIGSGGTSPGTNTDIVIQGVQSAGQAVDNQTADRGFYIQNASNAGIGTTGEHARVWVWHTHYRYITKLAVRLASSTPLTNFHAHHYPIAAEYPFVGGWRPIWIDANRTPDQAGGTFDKTAWSHTGIVCHIPDVALVGGSHNMVMDAIDNTILGGLVCKLEGTSGTWGDIINADQGNTSNRYGIMQRQGDVILQFASVLLATEAGSLVFSDSEFILVFPDQALVRNGFMSIGIDLGHASTNITFRNAVFQSAGAKQGRIAVVRKKGVLLVDTTTFQNLSSIQLTAGCQVIGGSMIESKFCRQDDALIQDVLVKGALTADGVAFMRVSDPGDLQNCAFTFSDGHAIEVRSLIKQVWQVDVSVPTFDDQTGEATDDVLNADNLPGVLGDFLPIPASEEVGDYCAIGFDQKFRKLVWDNSSVDGLAGAGGTVTWEYWNGSSWAALSNVSDGTNSFKAAKGVQVLTFDVPADWATLTLNGAGPYYYVRARVTATYTTNPEYDNLIVQGDFTYTFAGNTFSGYGAGGTNDAALFNNTGGTLTLNITNGGDTPTVRNGAGASTVLNNTVTLSVTVKDEAGNLIQNAQTAIVRDSDGAVLMNEDTDVNGLATEPFNFVSNTPVSVRVRKGSVADTTKYEPVNSPQTITVSGLTVTITLSVDAVNKS